MIKRLSLLFMVVLLQVSCTGVPRDITPIDAFDAQRYLGTWYEIARLDHSFEKGLEQVTAQYSMRGDGGIKVLNKGYAANTATWKEAEGRAYFVGKENIGHLKVSFFGPFYGSYVIFKIDEAGYQYAYVTSYNKDFLWLLARTPTVSDAVRSDFINTAKEHGFNVDELIFVKQGSPAP